MKFSAKNSVHSESTIQKNLLERFFGGSKNIVFKTVLLVLGLVSMLGSTHALFNGTVGLDLGFNTGSPIEFNDYIRAIVEQPDGKILVGGAYTMFSGITTNTIVRLNANGSRNTGFNMGAGFNAYVYALAIQSDGKILVGGTFTTYKGITEKYIIRLNTDGSKDTSFVVGGGFNSNVHAIVVQDDGKILVGGAFTAYSGVTSNRIIRLNSSGTIDSSFTIGSGFDNYPYLNAIKIQTDGKIVVGGLFTNYSGAAASKIIRLNTDGSKDTSFVVGGGFNSNVHAIVVQDDGKILVGGAFTAYSGVTSNGITRLNTDGTKDTSFLGAGANTSVYGIAVQTGGKIIVGGAFTAYSSVAARYIVGLNTDGTRDTSFNIGAGLDTTSYAIYVQSDGKILVGGGFTQYNGLAANRILRVNTDGSKDMTFAVGNGFNAYIITQKIQSDGKIIVGGNFTTYSGLATNRIMRLNTDGIRDTTFTIGGGFDDAVRSIALQSDGKIIVGGAFAAYSGVSALRIIRLNTDGTRDATFSVGGANSTVYALAIQTGDKIIVGGIFTTYSGVAATNYIVGLNADGTRDTSFNIGAGFNGYVYALAVQSDGKILVGGNAFTTYSGTTASRIIRLNADGTRDTSFLIGGGFNALVATFAIQPDGKILVGGSFTTYSGATAKYIARLHTNGLLDTGFSVGTSFSSTVRSIVLQSDGKILAGGSFTAYSGVAAKYITRLNADGTKDPTFSIGAGFSDLVYTLGIQNNGKITAGGTFNSFDGELVGYFAQLYEIQPPTLISPIDSFVVHGSGETLLRNTSPEIGITGYLYQISTDSSFATFFASGDVSTTGVFLTGLADEEEYYRRVAAYDTAGNTSLRSITGTFSVDMSLPVFVRTGSTPADNSWISTNYFTAQLDITESFFRNLSWSRSGIAYQLYDESLLLMMNFDKVSALGESDGNIIDASLLGINGSGYGGVVWTGGKYGGAYQSITTTQYVGTPTRVLGADATIAMRANASVVDPSMLWNHPSNLSTTYFDLYFSAGKIYFNTADAYGNPFKSGGVDILQLSINERHHYTMVIDSTNNKTYLYIDGSLAGEAVYKNPTSTAARVFIIGGPTSYRWRGSFDEARVYNRVLSSGEISLLYSSNLNKYDTDKWNFTILQTGMLTGIMYTYTGIVNNIGTGRSVGQGEEVPSDTTPPTFTFANNSGPECDLGSLTITSAVDTGVGVHDTSPYSFDGVAWNLTASTSITAQQAGTQVRTGRVRDQSENAASHTATYTFTDVAPTADDFTGYATVGNTSRTVNWKTLSNAAEGSCSTDDIIYDSIVSQGSKGTCSVVGNNITYTPNTGQVGSDACTLRIKDNENTTTDIVVSRGNIDTSGPSSPVLLSPANGSSSTTGSVNLLRSGSIDVGVGLSGYVWQLSTGSNFAVLVTGGFTTTTGVFIGGLSTTTYYRRVYALDILDNSGSRSTSRSFIIAPAISFAIESPSALALGNIPVPEVTQIVEKVFTGTENYFTIADYLGNDDGYYTTLSMSNMADEHGNILSNNNIAIKSASSIVTLAGSENTNVTSAIGGSSYVTFGNDVLTFIKRDAGPNDGVTGTYGVSPALKLTIPELQNIGNYSGTLIYTIYPN